MDSSQWRDYYSDLGVRPTATSQEIRRAFLALARTTHPDKRAPGDRSDSSKFRKVREVFEFLKDPANRTRYDTTYHDSKRSYERHRQWQKAEAQHQAEAEARQETDEENQRREEVRQRKVEKQRQREEARKQARRERINRRRAAWRQANKEQREAEQREARRRAQQTLDDLQRRQEMRGNTQRQEEQAHLDAIRREAALLAGGCFQK
ncbi:DnAJ-like protein [Colletotrichum siamense]|uniref:DnAJ-like protein n=1 Tax=Colletotrichum siamense TaxID=690259 RepID=UPI0018728733|nr:DnAJ-like protein [Colletotrichum siamense]KAF5495296.1 DnAJ-like protein [Colletotrichum siamense]